MMSRAGMVIETIRLAVVSGHKWSEIGLYISVSIVR